jgi:hypothetical protein
MTATTAAPPTTAPRRGEMNRIVAVVRLHFVNTWTILVVPALIMAAILLMNIFVWWLIVENIQSPSDRANAQEGFSYSGAAFYVFIYMMVVAIQAINLTFPYALGYGVTRRNFYLGSAVAFVILSALWAVVLTILCYIELATDGWGLGGRMFSSVYFGDGQWYQRLMLYFAAFLFFFFFGSGVATLYVRWKANGVLAFFAVVALLIVGLLTLVVLTQSWAVVGEWFVANGAYGVAAWSLVPAALSALAGYFILLRATPRN